MKQIKSPQQLSKQTRKLKSAGKTIVIVPTMGALHEGHLSLIRRAKKVADYVVLTIFVNPLQFGVNEDFGAYPRTLKEDLALAKKLEVDFVFTPKASDLYPVDFQTLVSVGELTSKLCGKSRPGHFDGVCTIVLKLFQLTHADFGIFGKKDYQQYLVIQKMVEDLNLPIKIIGAPISRERSGMARSSRNQYLSTDQYQQALSLSASLKLAKKVIVKDKIWKINQLKKIIEKRIKQETSIKIDYIEILDAKNLKSITIYQPKRTLIALAVKIGKTRLIDNMVV